MDKRLLDSLWNHYWVSTLSSSPLLTNAEYTTGQINDLADKLEMWDTGPGRSTLLMQEAAAASSSSATATTDKKTEDKLVKATKVTCRFTLRFATSCLK